MSLPAKGAVALDDVLVPGAAGIAGEITPADLSDGRAPGIGGFLALAVRLAAAAHAIHQQRSFHGAINPATILIEASPAGAAGQPLVRLRAPDLAAKASPRDPGGRLAYSSPEQTGRVSWGVDHRTDCYTRPTPGAPRRSRRFKEPPCPPFGCCWPTITPSSARGCARSARSRAGFRWWARRPTARRSCAWPPSWSRT